MILQIVVSVRVKAAISVNVMSEYKDKRWEKKRIVILKRDMYTCQMCKQYGKGTEANTAHHIFPLEYYPDYKYCNWNLISLCSKCHNAMHDRDTHELTSAGKRLMFKTEKERIKYESTRPRPGLEI